MVTMFKRQAKMGAVMDRDMSVTVEELIELYVVLVSMTGFMDVSRNILIGTTIYLIPFVV